MSRNIGLGKAMPHRMVWRQVEDGHHLGVRLAFADQAKVSPTAKREAKRIKKDRLAGACLAGEHGQATIEGQRQPLDQNDVGDRQAVQHG